MVLWGHRSIVNQTRYNWKKCILASAGVEKVVKLWRPFQMDGWVGDLKFYLPNEPPYARAIYSHEEYARMQQRPMAHHNNVPDFYQDFSQQTTTEDPQMMAFFDILVQRELESWNTEEEKDTDTDKSSGDHSSDDSSRRTSTLPSESDGRGKKI